MSAPLAPAADAGGSEPPRYRPQLDGIRAVAVYLVIAFHAGLGVMTGGFVGVDVFFVLSGYLVTQLLLRDLLGAGRIRLGYFYSRRFRRLLPASAATLLVTTIVFAAIAAPAEVADALGGIRASFLYVANWYFIHQSSNYFGTNISASPVTHFWSLAIEEQFYLCWPLLLMLLFVLTRRLGPRQWTAIRVTVAAAGLASVAAALVISSTNLNRAYFGTDTRAYQLLAGALLALPPGIVASTARFRRWLRPVAALSLIGLGVVATSLIHIGPIQRGVVVAVLAVLLIAGVEAGERGTAQRGLSLAPVAFLGRISYGTYLWHWLVILVATRAFHPSPLSLFAISALVATALASLSFQLLEHPIRASRVLERYRVPVIAVGLTVSIISAVVLVPAITRSSRSKTFANATGSSTSSGVQPAALDWQAVETEDRSVPDCFERPIASCIVVHGSGPTVALIGDSHAEMFLSSFVGVAKREHWTLAILTKHSCPWQDGLYRFGNVSRAACLAEKRDLWNRILPQLDPRLVILVHAPLDREGVGGLHLGGPSGPLETGSPAAERAIEAASAETVARYRRQGRDVVIIEPIPQAPQGYDPLACISHATNLDQCRFIASARPTALERFYRKLDRADPHVWSFDVDRLICPYLPICDPVVNGHIVWFDLSHISVLFAPTLAGPLDDLFRRNGVANG